ncbi:TraR/DksA C4-type zinc finger protein, partial [Herbiconiux daphne]
VMPHNDRHQLKMNATIDFGIAAARSQLGTGESETHCLDCGKSIPQKRREIVKGCKYCITCQSNHDKRITLPYERQ